MPITQISASPAGKVPAGLEQLVIPAYDASTGRSEALLIPGLYTVANMTAFCRWRQRGAGSTAIPDVARRIGR